MIIGITGKIGVGKSTVGRIFKRNGIFFIDADKIVAKLYKKGELGVQKIQNFFGPEFLKKDGSVNRKKLRRTVFNNEKKLQILEKMIHPLVCHEVKKEIDQYHAEHKKIRHLKRAKRSEGSLIVIEAIHFHPKYLGKFIDKLIFVTCPPKIVKKRIAKRKISSEEFENIIKKQIPPEKYDYEMKNNGNLKDLKENCSKILAML